MELADWIEGYRRAWEQNDADLLLTLFTEDAFYRSSPFREPNLEEGTITLPGCLLLQFAPDGRCFDLREYWNVQDGTVSPYQGWGSWRRR